MTRANDIGRAVLNPNLTDAEAKVVSLMQAGRSIRQIAREWGVTPDTIRSFLRRARIKLDLRASPRHHSPMTAPTITQARR